MEEDETVREGKGGCPTEGQLASFDWTTAPDAVAVHISRCKRCSAFIATKTPEATAADPTVLAADTMVGRYRIVERLGQGGMGVVYRALDTELDRPVALKLVRGQATDDLDMLTERLRRESRLQARASHSGVIAVHDIGRDGNRVYVAMELALGGTLRAWLARKARSWREIVDVFRRAGEGLAAAHAAGLVHRDFKPDNVLVEQDGELVTRVLVTDFGVARAVEAAEYSSSATTHDMSMTATGAVIGTPAYMAPEQLKAAPVDARTDEFAFGIALWEALYGARPYVAGSIHELEAAMAAPLRDPPAGRNRVPRWLARVLRRALAIDPDQRWASMPALLHALDWRRRRAQGRLVVVVGSLAAVFGVAAGLAVTPTAAQPSPCDDDPAGAAALRNATRRLQSAGGDDATGHRDQWSHALETYAATTAKLRVETCRAQPRAPNWQDRIRCLDRSVAGMAATVEQIAAVDPVRRGQLVDMSPPSPPSECASDAAATVASVYPPEALRVEVGATRFAVTEAIAIARIDPDAAAKSLDQLSERAVRLGFIPLIHELALERAQLRDETVRRGDTLRDVAVAAERDGAYVVAARAWLGVTLDRVKHELPKAMEDSLAQSDVALARVGNPPRERAHWYLAKAVMFGTQLNVAEAEKAIAAAEDAHARGQVPQDLTFIENIAIVESQIHNPTRSLALAKQAFDLVAARSPSDDEAIGARSLYAIALAGDGQLEEGRKILEPIEAAADPSRPVSPNLADAIQHLATTYDDLERFEDGIRIITRWQPAFDRDLGANPLAAGELAHEHARAAFGLSRYAEAEETSAHALEVFVEHNGASSYGTADVRVLHGQILLRWHKFDAARVELERGTKDLIAAAGENDPIALQGRVMLAEALLGENRPADALPLLQAAFEPFKKTESNPAVIALAELHFAEALAGVHRDLPRARTLAAHALVELTANLDAGADEIAEAKALVAKLR